MVESIKAVSWWSLAFLSLFTRILSARISSIPFSPIRLRKWTSSEALQGKERVNSYMPQKYWKQAFSLHCSTTDSSERLRKYLRINKPHIKRIGLSGRPLSEQYNGVKPFSILSSRFYVKIYTEDAAGLTNHLERRIKSEPVSYTHLRAHET